MNNEQLKQRIEMIEECILDLALLLQNEVKSKETIYQEISKKIFDFEENKKNIKKITKDQIVILPFEEFQDKTIKELSQHLIAYYANDYYFPTQVDLQYFLNNPDKAPEEMKNGKWYYFFSPDVCGSAGHQWIPAFGWLISSFDRCMVKFDYSWQSVDRVILIKKT